MSEMDQNENSPILGLCQLPPAADITPQMLTPLGAKERTRSRGSALRAKAGASGSRYKVTVG